MSGDQGIDVFRGVAMVLWIVGIHFIEANLLNPKIIGGAAKIHPVLVIFSLFLGEQQLWPGRCAPRGAAAVGDPGRVHVLLSQALEELAAHEGRDRAPPSDAILITLIEGAAGGTPLVMRLISALNVVIAAVAATIVAAGGAAEAQPADQPMDPYKPPAEDPVLAEQVAQALVARAQELFDARVFVDAKQLAVEAIVKSPNGPAAAQAKFIIGQVNQQLGISDDTSQSPDKPVPPVDMTPVNPSRVKQPAPTTQPEGPRERRWTASSVHGALYGGLLGATVGAALTKKHPARGAVPGGLALGIVGGLVAPRAADKLGWSEAQIRTAGMGSVWGGVIGGLFADAVEITGTNARKVLLGASIGSTVGILGGSALARRNRLTRGDIALVDTLAGIGTAGGFTIGMVMQPAEGEAYSVNAILGAAGGVIVGMIAAPSTNTTPRRMLRVAGLAAAGGAVPFLLYAGIHDATTTSDEQTVGLLASAGLVAGAYVGFRLTRGMDDGLDTLDGKLHVQVDDAPVSLLQHHSDGRWALGSIALQPLSAELAPQRGMSVPLVGAAF